MVLMMPSDIWSCNSNVLPSMYLGPNVDRAMRSNWESIYINNEYLSKAFVRILDEPNRKGAWYYPPLRKINYKFHPRISEDKYSFFSVDEYPEDVLVLKNEVGVMIELTGITGDNIFSDICMVRYLVVPQLDESQ